MMQRTANLHCPVFFGAVGLFRSDMLLIFQLTWFRHDSPAGQFVSVRSFLIATTSIWGSDFFRVYVSPRIYVVYHVVVISLLVTT